MKTTIDKLNSVPMLWISGIFLAVSFVAEYMFPLMGWGYEFPVNPAWVSLLISGTPLAYLAVVRTLAGRITSPLLITIAMVAAVCIGDVFAAGEVAFIMAIGEWLEDRTVEKAKRGIEKLISLVPCEARRIFRNGQECMIEARSIVTGDILRVLAGESFPADGCIIKGNTSVDQSIITGESLPVDKSEGDEVFTGTINRFGCVDIEVCQAFEDSSLQKMIRMVEEAENNKAPMQKIVDKWASYIVPSACAIAVISYLVLRYAMDMPDEALIRAVTVLVVFCPCALALATPTAIMAAVGQATKQGVLIKSGEALELMGKVNTIAFDKTGTITQGRLRISDIQAEGMGEEDLLRLVASVESRSEHPIGKALVQGACEKCMDLLAVDDFSMQLGKGVQARVQGKLVKCGNEQLIDAPLESWQGSIDEWSSQGKAIIIVTVEREVVGIIALSDQIKASSTQAIANLADAGIAKSILLTGDKQACAQFVAQQVGISEVKAGLLPEGKVAAIQHYQEQGETLCMVGDGVNDAPALKTASVGIAMGTMGSDIAIDASDIAIMGDDLSKIAYIKRLSNATIASIKFNITLAMLINFVAIILSVMGILNPALGALVHNAGSVLVVLNAARLYDRKI